MHFPFPVYSTPIYSSRATAELCRKRLLRSGYRDVTIADAAEYDPRDTSTPRFYVQAWR